MSLFDEAPTTAAKHPAPFTDSIIDALAELIPRHVPAGFGIHDPFGGEGVKLGGLCDRLGYRFTGTDLEPWLEGDPRVAVGDSTNAASYPDWPFVVVTSPTYNNGVNDHFAPKDKSERLTYRVRAGHPLHPNNTGRWSGRGSKKGEAEYWRLTREVVKHWPDLALVNVKDSVRSTWEGGVYPLCRLWTELLEEHGYSVTSEDVACPGWRFGANGQDRIDTEAVLIARRQIPGQGGAAVTCKVEVPRALVDELQRARAVARNAADAIANHVGFDHLTGRLPLCGEYDGQHQEWRGVVHWDDCWHCGWPRDEHTPAASTYEEGP